MSDLQSFRISQDPIILENLDLKDKNVLIKVDYNCPVENGVVTNNYRIRESLETLNKIKEKGAKKITLITHFKRPKGEYDPELSLGLIRKELEKLWGEKVYCPPYNLDFKKYSGIFKNFDIDSEEAKKLQFAGYQLHVLMWENIRFWPGEKSNDPGFAKALVEGQDIFVNEAFSAAHRAHASVVGVAKLLPAYAGYNLAQEVREIYRLLNDSLSPSVAIVGGAKIETKIPLLQALSKNYDKIILGGKIAIEYEELYKKNNVENVVDTHSKPVFTESWTKKIELPAGYLGEQKFDIDESSALHFAEIIKRAKKILWNGPVGKFEEPEFRKGSEVIAKAVAGNEEASKLIGGGDTVELLEELGLQNQVGFVSTGGGAMLEYIAKGTLPGLEVLEY